MKTMFIAIFVVGFAIGLLMLIGFKPRRFLERLESKTSRRRSGGLLEAVRSGDSSAARKLLTRGPYVPRGEALRLASELGNIEMMTLLLEHRADVSGETGNPMLPPPETPLLAALMGQQAEAVRFLLEHGAKADVRLEGGRTALEEAGERGVSVPEEVKDLLRQAATR